MSPHVSALDYEEAAVRIFKDMFVAITALNSWHWSDAYTPMACVHQGHPWYSGSNNCRPRPFEPGPKAERTLAAIEDGPTPGGDGDAPDKLFAEFRVA